jgi:hypothetical protein
MELPTKEQVDDYLKSPSFCLFCQDGSVEGDSIEIHAAGATQKVHCTECGKQWTDFYELSAVGISADSPKTNAWYSDETQFVKSKVTGKEYYPHEPEAESINKKL